MFIERQFVTYLVILSVINLFYTAVTGSPDFGYSGEMGPDHWSEKYSTCVGKYQSPININDEDVRRVWLMPLDFKNIHASLEEGKIINNGHTVMLQFENGHSPTVSGGMLYDEYKFSQLHFHWGDDDKIGSENKINNISFPLELHVVFYKIPYENFKKAMSHNDGLTVLSFLYEISHEDNENYNEFIKVLSQVQQVEMSTTVPKRLTLSSLIGTDLKNYYTYNGSLTTPPCSEVVQWIEFKKTIPLSHRQIEQFRKLQGYDGYIQYNFRPVQPTNGRPILYNEERILKTNFKSNSYLPLFNNLLIILIFINVYL